MILSLSLFAIGVFCYAIRDLQSHGKLKGMKDDARFWGEKSHERKWKWVEDNWARDHKVEAFPLSSTALVWLTDGYHLMQFIYLKLFVLSIVLYTPVFGWWKDGLIYLGVYYVVFNAFYKIFQK